VALVVPSVPGALLRVKLKSLRAWPALLIADAKRSLESVIEIEPELVVKSALAASAPSDPVPLAVKVMATAAAG
jgi:hypothetical protein